MEKNILMTFTGEVIQPIRLNYKVINKTKLIDSINKIQDIEYIQENNLFKWLLKKGDKKFGLKVPKDINKFENKDIVLGNLIINNDNLHIILPSIKRAIIAIQFFDKNISREVAKIETLDVMNCFFEDSDENKKEIINIECIFDNKEITRKDFNLLLKEVNELRNKGLPQSQITEFVSKKLEEDSKKDLPYIENLPANYYSDGINQIESILLMREIVIFEQFNGNKNFTMHDVIKATINKSKMNLEISKNNRKYIN